MLTFCTPGTCSSRCAQRFRFARQQSRGQARRLQRVEGETDVRIFVVDEGAEHA